MANLKLIKVTGSPFSDTVYGCIGIQVTDSQFQIIKNGILNTQSSYGGKGWKYATAEQIKENWAAIYPHWTPEVGDNVIVTQDYSGWANCKGTITAKDGSSDYYRVESETGRSCIFDYSSQMILAPYSKSIVEPTIEPEETATTKFKEGDRVKCIGITARGYGKVGTVRKAETSIGVEFDEDIGGHYLDGCCENGYGWWIKSSDLELVTESTPKEETVSIRFLTEQEFRDKGLFGNYAPQGWHSGGEMNKYLGQSVVIPKSSIGSDGSFVYQYWSFKVTDYIVTEWIPSKVDDFRDVSKTIASSSVPVGSSQPATRLIIKGSSAAGDANGVFVGGKFYPISSSSSVHPIPPTCGTYSTIATINPDPLSLYEQKPITIKPKPKTKLTTI